MLLHFAGERLDEAVSLVGVWAVLGALRASVQDTLDQKKYQMLVNTMKNLQFDQLISIISDGF